VAFPCRRRHRRPFSWTGVAAGEQRGAGRVRASASNAKVVHETLYRSGPRRSIAGGPDLRVSVAAEHPGREVFRRESGRYWASRRPAFFRGEGRAGPRPAQEKMAAREVS